MEESCRKRMDAHGAPKFPVWIIEHIWAHKMMDIQEVVDPSSWPDVDSQPLSLEDSWRLRVVSAQVYSIVKSRDTKNYERVMGFLDTTYRLLPRLVRAIKHMKILFGLKTMVIMWMLKEGKGMINIVSKIGQFFPNKLPQYQDQCSQREMFLMRKNHVEFKSFAQTLTISKDRREEYIKNQMEEHYGEHYAEKVQDRLLHYLHELESALPGDTYIDKIMKKHSPVTKEEKLLLEVITSDSVTIAATLRKLLHGDVATCCPAGIFPPSVREKKEAEVSQLSESSLHGSFTKSGERKNALEIQSVVFREVGRGDPSKQSPLLLESESSPDIQEVQQSEEDNEAVRRMEDRRTENKEDCSQGCRERGKDVSSSPQFCSRHQRWVKSILRGCPDNCSEELLHQANVSSSPVLFQSSSSTFSSQDLTPSDLVPSPADQPPSQTPETTNTGDKRRSGSPETTSGPSQRAALLQHTSRKTSPLPALMSPVVRLVDITSFRGRHQKISSHHVTVFMTKPASIIPLASSLCCASGNKDSTFVLPETGPNLQTASEHQDVSACTSRQPPVRQTSSKLPYKFRRACGTSRHSQALTNKSTAELSVKNWATFPISCPLLSSDLHLPKNASTSTPDTLNKFSVCTDKQIRSSVGSPQQIVHQDSDKPHPGSHNTSTFRNKPISCHVRLTRLSAQECRRATEGRASAGQEESVRQSSGGDEQTKGTQENVTCSFDVNTLYSSGSSSSDWEDLGGPDPDYKPCIKKKRLLLEYESARILNHT